VLQILSGPNLELSGNKASLDSLCSRN